jgi:tRNA (adenine37-N6)-methyltransferase
VRRIWTAVGFFSLVILEGCQMQMPSDERGSEPRYYTLCAIGTVEKKDGRTFIVLDKKYEAGLAGLERHAHVHVVYWFDRNDTPEQRAILHVHPMGNPRNPLTGVFATHSPVRPNLIGISRCDIIAVAGNVIEVRDIDAFDGSPVLDLKGDFSIFHRP